MTEYVPGTGHLPPMPDLQTGEPRPPAAPRAWNGKEVTPSDRLPRRHPQSPEDLGPILEWSQQSKRSAFLYAAVVFAIGIVALTIAWHGLGWMVLWFFWLLPLMMSIGMYFSMKKGWVAAGACWVQNREKYVEIYDLRYVEIKVSGNNQMLRMTDGSGRKIQSLSLLDAQTNPALWNLLYNGIRHSVASGKASPSRKTRNILDL